MPGDYRELVFAASLAKAKVNLARGPTPRVSAFVEPYGTVAASYSVDLAIDPVLFGAAPKDIAGRDLVERAYFWKTLGRDD